MRSRNKYFVIIFVLAITLAGAYILLVKDKPQISQLEKRKLSRIESITISNWINKYFQDSIESTLADHFIGRNLWLKQFSRLELSLNDISDSFVSLVFNKQANNQISVQKINENVNLVTINGIRHLVRPSHVFDENTEKAIMSNIDKINYLSKKYKDINFYVYLPTMANDTNLFDAEASGEQYISLFNKLEIPHSKLKVNTIPDYERMFFKTDHHWNHIGAYQGYSDIINLLFSGNQKPNVPIMEKTFDNFRFHGSLSAQAAHSIDMEGDILSKYLFQLPPYKLYIDGKSVEEYGNYSKYINGEIDKTFGFDHYNNLYQSRKGEIIFDTNKEEYDNILIVSDSMSNPIRDVIASHFNKSVFINLDMYNYEIGEFDLERYIKEYKVKKVLVMVVLANYFPEGELKYLNVSEN